MYILNFLNCLTVKYSLHFIYWKFVFINVFPSLAFPCQPLIYGNFLLNVLCKNYNYYNSNIRGQISVLEVTVVAKRSFWLSITCIREVWNLCWRPVVEALPTLLLNLYLDATTWEVRLMCGPWVCSCMPCFADFYPLMTRILQHCIVKFRW